MSIFESVMLICFGFAWPFQIHHSYVSRTAKGKSAIFSYVVIVGYAAGILHKVIYSMDGVIYLYIADLIMVIIDLMLYYRNRALDRKADAERLSDR
ncbi:hypothetical protein IKS38_00370 [bacterium]|nr:hypothetical protein [bacterium]